MDTALETIQRCGYTRVGILGGTFNPIHCEHIAMCHAAMQEFSLDAVLLIPSGQPPHKKGKGVASKEDRFAMVSLAIENSKSLLASRLEIDRENTTFTVDTMRELCDTLPNITWYYIIGSDTLHTLSDWKEYQTVLSQCVLINFSRENQVKIDDQIFVKKQYNHLIDRFMFASMHPKAISSTQIRRLITQKISVKQWLPENVMNYIAKHQLYTHSALTLEEVIDRLEQALSKRRFIHTMGVMETAEKLADRHGQDVARARWGGLLHDCAKEVPIEQAKQLQKEGLIHLEPDLFEYAPQLIHSKLGVYWAKTYYDMWDEIVLDAISNHTIGNATMTDLDKIVFLADMIEPNRKGAEVGYFRDLAFENLDEAMLAALNNGIQRLVHKNKFIHPEAIQARNAFWKYSKH